MKLPKLPSLTTSIPGPESKRLAKELRKFECPQITYIDKDFPVFWQSAEGCSIQDVDGNVYVDLTGAFGVANCGHNNPAIIKAAKKQMDTLTHGMGDVHPNPLKIDLARAIAEITPGNLTLSIFSSSGSEAVDTSLKTAYIATGKPGIISFSGAYHGLTLGALNATAWEMFRNPFTPLLPQNHHILPFPDSSPVNWKSGDDELCEKTLAEIEKTLSQAEKSPCPIGAIIIEPVQGRGGCRIPVKGFLKGLRQITKDRNVLLIFDEVYSGYCRTGKWFASEHEKVVPDLLCMGKGMSNGFPISACIGSKDIMNQWGPSQGEAIHTSTFLGHPVGCAMGLSTIQEMKKINLPFIAKETGDYCSQQLNLALSRYPYIGDIRGRGLMIGIELTDLNKNGLKAGEIAVSIMKQSLKKGLILLTSGEESNILCLTPPLVISKKQIDYAVKILDEIFQNISQGRLA